MTGVEMMVKERMAERHREAETERAGAAFAARAPRWRRRIPGIVAAGGALFGVRRRAAVRRRALRAALGF